MLLRSTLVVALLAVAIPAQSDTRPPKNKDPQQVQQTLVESIFYRAFYTERALKDEPGAIALYREFLRKAPDNLLAGQAARFASALLEKAGKKDEARAIRDRHKDIIAETLQAGINASFLDPKGDINRMINRFESESREISKHRRKILDLIGLKKGQAIADIGAGTGLFTNLFARAVGDKGKVYAVDIGPIMVAQLLRVKKKMNLPQVEVVLCTERSAKLAPNSIDVAFICDTYHHFSHPPDTMASILKALRPGGQLILIDFRRIEGKTRAWVMGHVRAGQEVFRKEIEKAGFRFIREESAPYLEENYVLRFERPRSV